MTELTRTHEHFLGFCCYLVRERGFSAKDLLQVIDTPHSWEPEFSEWRELCTEPCMCGHIHYDGGDCCPRLRCTCGEFRRGDRLACDYCGDRFTPDDVTRHHEYNDWLCQTCEERL